MEPWHLDTVVALTSKRRHIATVKKGRSLSHGPMQSYRFKSSSPRAALCKLFGSLLTNFPGIVESREDCLGQTWKQLKEAVMGSNSEPAEGCEAKRGGRVGGCMLHTDSTPLELKEGLAARVMHGPT
jgi:hypothetical protein